MNPNIITIPLMKGGGCSMLADFELIETMSDDDLEIDGFSAKTGATECGSSCVDSCCC